MYKYAATGECALLLRYLLCPSPCHIHRVATPSSPPTYPDILLSCRLEMLDWTREMSNKKYCSWFSELPDFIEAWRLIAGLGKLAFDEVWCPPKFPPTIYWLLPSIIHPWIWTQHVAAIGENILNQVQGTKCKCESVLSSWISINHNHALNIIIEKTVNSCVRVWNAEFSITHLYKFPDD